MPVIPLKAGIAPGGSSWETFGTMIYIALIHQDEVEGWFAVSFPDFPSCVTAGNTLAEVKTMATWALRDHLRALRRAGRAIPAPSTPDAVVQQADYPDSVALLLIEAPVS